MSKMKGINVLPLVSVLCRSMNRPELAEALVSVSKQTYDNIEIVLVDASGKGLDQHKNLSVRFPVIEVSEGRALNRPAAANLALKNANGSYLMFLDEDDWIGIGHVSQLVESLENNPDIGVVYSSTQKTLASGALTEDTLSVPYDLARLRRDNFIPIHSAMFRKFLVTDGVGFDENLDVFEDWDFWLQLATKTEFLHIDVLTAFYRQGGNSNTASDDPMTRYASGHPIAAARERVFDKWLPEWKGKELNQVLHSLDAAVLVESLHKDIRRLNIFAQDADAEITQLNNDLEASNTQIAGLNNEIHGLNHTVNKLNQTVSRKNAELQETKAHIEHLSQYIHMLQSSLSWRVTKPLRWLRRRLDSLRPARPVSEMKTQQPSPGQQHRLPEETSAIQGNLDIPSATHNEFPEQVTLQGWCCSPNGISRIDALVDGLVVSSFSTGISRPDIAELFPDFPEVFSSGFHQDLALPDHEAGEHTLELRFTDNAGQQSSITRQFFLFKNSDLYNTWYWRNMPDDSELAQLRTIANSTSAASAPEFNLLVTGADEGTLLKTLSSLAEQVWPHWALHIQSAPIPVINNFVKTTFGGRKIYWHETLPVALSVLAKDSAWTALLKAGETLAPHALMELVPLAQSQDLQLIYSDHDQVSQSGMHLEPVFTPQWSPEHLLSSNYIGGFFAFKSSHLQNWQTPDLQNPTWRYGLLMTIADAIADAPDSVRRVAKVLWSEPESSATQDHQQAELIALRAHLSRTCAEAEVLETEHGTRAVLWPLASTPKVSIIIPTMGKLDLIKPCIDSLIEKTDYPDFEIVMLDNSRGKFPEGIQYLKDRKLNVIECNEAFNWARLNNTGVRHASGDLLLFLNDDIEITTADWLQQLVRQALRPQVGAVGALLYYPNGALQHTGVLLVNYGGGGIHLLHKRMPGQKIYRQLHQTVREVSANTGACLMVSREKFEEINGFDEELAVVGNDVDLCLRLLEKGYRNIWTPLCHLIHHESISRKTSVPKEDEKAMWLRWGKRFIAGDDYYNPNLSADKGDFTLQVNSLRVRSALSASAVSAPQPQALLSGVNLIGYTRAEMGIGEGARSDARALDAANEPFGIICFTSGNPSRMTDLSWQHKEIDTTPYDITLLHINPDHALQAIAELPSNHFDGHYSIGYWAWELPEIPPDWEKAFKHFDEIWVPSSFVQDAVAMKSPVPVVRIPHAIEVKADTTLTRTDFGLPQDPFLFLVMFDTYSRQERKNPYGAIEAFRKSFSADDMSVRLVIKVNNANPGALREIRERAGDHQNVILLDQVYSRTEVNAIIANCDCFVSLHRSEGFGFGPAEAMASGKAIMATNWSGNIDYMRPDNSVGINYQLVTIEQDYGPYKKGQVWAEPDIEQAAQAMTQLASDRDLVDRLGRNARATIENEFSPVAVGTMMRKRLAAIRRIRSGSD
ncbi:MAG: glycosyltransferase [Pseudohongiella sp.]|nr:glycosyltransferase [Pseudohongiella sp.]